MSAQKRFKNPPLCSACQSHFSVPEHKNGKKNLDLIALYQGFHVSEKHDFPDHYVCPCCCHLYAHCTQRNDHFAGSLKHLKQSKKEILARIERKDAIAAARENSHTVVASNNSARKHEELRHTNTREPRDDAELRSELPSDLAESFGFGISFLLDFYQDVLRKKGKKPSQSDWLNLEPPNGETEKFREYKRVFRSKHLLYKTILAGQRPFHPGCRAKDPGIPGLIVIDQQYLNNTLKLNPYDLFVAYIADIAANPDIAKKEIALDLIAPTNTNRGKIIGSVLVQFGYVCIVGRNFMTEERYLALQQSRPDLFSLSEERASRLLDQALEEINARYIQTKLMKLNTGLTPETPVDVQLKELWDRCPSKPGAVPGSTRNIGSDPVPVPQAMETTMTPHVDPVSIDQIHSAINHRKVNNEKARTVRTRLKETINSIGGKQKSLPELSHRTASSLETGKQPANCVSIAEQTRVNIRIDEKTGQPVTSRTTESGIMFLIWETMTGFVNALLENDMLQLPLPPPIVVPEFPPGPPDLWYQLNGTAVDPARDRTCCSPPPIPKDKLVILYQMFYDSSPMEGNKSVVVFQINFTFMPTLMKPEHQYSSLFTTRFPWITYFGSETREGLQVIIAKLQAELNNLSSTYSVTTKDGTTLNVQFMGDLLRADIKANCVLCGIGNGEYGCQCCKALAVDFSNFGRSVVTQDLRWQDSIGWLKYRHFYNGLSIDASREIFQNPSIFLLPDLSTCLTEDLATLELYPPTLEHLEVVNCFMHGIKNISVPLFDFMLSQVNSNQQYKMRQFCYSVFSPFKKSSKQITFAGMSISDIRSWWLVFQSLKEFFKVSGCMSDAVHKSIFDLVEDFNIIIGLLYVTDHYAWDAQLWLCLRVTIFLFGVRIRQIIPASNPIYGRHFHSIERHLPNFSRNRLPFTGVGEANEGTFKYMRRDIQQHSNGREVLQAAARRQNARDKVKAHAKGDGYEGKQHKKKECPMLNYLLMKRRTVPKDFQEGKAWEYLVFDVRNYAPDLWSVITDNGDVEFFTSIHDTPPSFPVNPTVYELHLINQTGYQAVDNQYKSLVSRGYYNNRRDWLLIVESTRPNIFGPQRSPEYLEENRTSKSMEIEMKSRNEVMAMISPGSNQLKIPFRLKGDEKKAAMAIALKDNDSVRQQQLMQLEEGLINEGNPDVVTFVVEKRLSKLLESRARSGLESTSSSSMQMEDNGANYRDESNQQDEETETVGLDEEDPVLDELSVAVVAFVNTPSSSRIQSRRIDPSPSQSLVLNLRQVTNELAEIEEHDRLDALVGDKQLGDMDLEGSITESIARTRSVSESMESGEPSTQRPTRVIRHKRRMADANLVTHPKKGAPKGIPADGYASFMLSRTRTRGPYVARTPLTPVAGSSNIPQPPQLRGEAARGRPLGGQGGRGLPQVGDQLLDGRAGMADSPQQPRAVPPAAPPVAPGGSRAAAARRHRKDSDEAVETLLSMGTPTQYR